MKTFTFTKEQETTLMICLMDAALGRWADPEPALEALAVINPLMAKQTREARERELAEVEQ